MRTGGGAVQQHLAAEAAAVVRQAVSLARRRGHAQVTPLHVASAMLSNAGLLRDACILSHSHSHPLQGKALELCFNVALNRLPTAAAVFHHHAPVLSNALVAAFRRAQALQRRGSSAEGQQQQQQHPAALAVKVELEHLVISILDDPNVNRVMREAGHASSQVKTSVEKAVALEESNTASGNNTSPNLKAKCTDAAVRVLKCMANGRKRCVMVVGESAAAAEGAVRAVMDKVSKRELQRRHECLKNLEFVFVPLSIASFQRMPRQEVESKAGGLHALVREGLAAGKGVVLVLEDMGYAAKAWAAASPEDRRGGPRAHGNYWPVEHVVMEVSRLVGSGEGDERLWVLGFGNYTSYTNCRAGQPSLEAVWELHPIVVSDGGIAVGHGFDSVGQASQTRSRTGWPAFVGAAAGNSELTCFAAGRREPGTAMAGMASLPSWLCHYQDPVNNRSANCDATVELQDLCNSRWSNPTRFGCELTLSFPLLATASPAASSISGLTNCYIDLSSKPWPPLFPELRQQWPKPSHQHGDPTAEPYHHRSHANPNPDNSTSVCKSSGSASACHHRPKFTELTAENLKILCSPLEMRVPRHKDVIPGIASAVLHRRSGMARRRRERWPTLATWFILHGRDSDGKKAMAQELANLLFGSYAEFVSITLPELITPVSSGCSSSSDLAVKRKRSPENELGYAQKLYEEIRDNPHRVMMIHVGVEKSAYDMEIGIKNAIVEGQIRGCNSDVISLEDAIIMLTCEVFDSRSRASSPPLKQIRVVREDGEEEEDDADKEVKSHFSFDLNACAEAGDQDKEETYPLHDVEILDAVDGVFIFRSMDG